MIYSFDIGRLPKIENIYTVVRKTVWQIADPHHILLIILDGACNVELEEKSYRLQRGDILFIPENQIYKRTPENGSMCKMLYIHFTTAAPIKELSAAEAIEEVRAFQARTENALLNNVKSLLPQNSSIYLRTLCHAGGQDVLEICGRMERLLYKFSLDSTLSLVLYFCQILSVVSKGKPAVSESQGYECGSNTYPARPEKSSFVYQTKLLCKGHAGRPVPALQQVQITNHPGF